MGYPVSAILANPVMEHVEEKALSTAPNPWWFRYVDDSHVCEKREQVLNSSHISIPATLTSNSQSR